MSLDRLMNMDMEIVSASKNSQKSSDTASAVFVISSEDIKRSGAIYITVYVKDTYSIEFDFRF